MGAELRPGSQHSKNDFLPFLNRILHRVRRLTQQPTLLRLSGRLQRAHGIPCTETGSSQPLPSMATTGGTDRRQRFRTEPDTRATQWRGHELATNQRQSSYPGHRNRPESREQDRPLDCSLKPVRSRDGLPARSRPLDTGLRNRDDHISTGTPRRPSGQHQPVFKVGT